MLRVASPGESNVNQLRSVPIRVVLVLLLPLTGAVLSCSKPEEPQTTMDWDALFKEHYPQTEAEMKEYELSRLESFAPTVHAMMTASNWKDKDPIQKYRSVVPMMRKAYGGEDSEELLESLESIERNALLVAPTYALEATNSFLSESLDVWVSHFVHTIGNASFTDERFDSLGAIHELDGTEPWIEITDDLISCETGARERMKALSLEADLMLTGKISDISDYFESPADHDIVRLKLKQRLFHRELEYEIDPIFRESRESYGNEESTCNKAFLFDGYRLLGKL